MLENLPPTLGHALVNQRAGMDAVVYNQVAGLRPLARLELHSATFVFNGRLPVRYTADGAGLSPPLRWAGVPPGTASMALIVEDADSPTPHPWVHAIVVGLGNSPDGSIEEGALESPQHTGLGLVTGQNSMLSQSWLPPDPPPGHGEHRYVFQLFALHEGTPFSNVPGRREFIDVVRERALAVGCLIGTYERAERLTSLLEEPSVTPAAS